MLTQAYFGADTKIILFGKGEHLKSPDAGLQWKTIENMKSIRKIMWRAIGIGKAKHTILNADGIIDATLIWVSWARS